MQTVHRAGYYLDMPPQHLDIGRVFTRVFETYRDQAGLFIPVALALFIPVAILSALAQGSVVTSLVFAILAGLVSLIVVYAYQGMVVETVRDIQDGVRDQSVGDLFRSVVPVLPTLIGASILAVLGVFVGLLLLIVPGLVLLTWWAVIAPSIVLERMGAIEAFGRSRELVRGNGWQVFGVIVGLVVIQIVLSFIITAIIGVITFSPVGNAIASLITNTLFAPLTGIAAATMYLELRGLRGEAPISGAVDTAGLASGEVGASAGGSSAPSEQVPPPGPPGPPGAGGPGPEQPTPPPGAGPQPPR